METTNQRPKPAPILGICLPQIFLSRYKIQRLGTQDGPSLPFLKYFPKYIYSLPSDLSNHNLKTRVKRLKLIKKIPSDYSNGALKVLLSHQRKNIQFASSIEDRENKGGYDEQSLELLKMFPNLQKVEFCVGIPNFDDEEEHQNYQAIQCYWIDRMSNYLRSMANLKYLELSNHGHYFLPLLSKLNSFEAMLDRLEVFRLNFALFRAEDYPDFQALLDFKTVLKNLTHLILNPPEQKGFLEVFKPLPNYCSRLLSLVYTINQQNSFSTFEDVSYLQCLQSFQKLQKLVLKCRYKLDAFRHSKFPSSLRELDLYFDDTDWQSLIPEDSATVSFHSKQNDLGNLEKLQIFLDGYHSTAEEIIRDFIKDLLTRTLSLREFYLEFSPDIQEGNSSYHFDLSHFLSCFQHLSQSLQKLSIKDFDLKYNFTNLIKAQVFHFPELSYLSIQGRNLPSFPVLENLFELRQVRPEVPVPYIKFEKISIDSCQSLLELFNSLKKISGKSIKLVIIYQSKGDEDDDEYFRKNYKQVRQGSGNLKNVALKIIFLRGWFRWGKELQSLKDLFGNFIL